ncbi:MAG: hypothetical protein AAFV95_29370, partial [Bacteroidota bacterium]
IGQQAWNLVIFVITVEIVLIPILLGGSGFSWVMVKVWPFERGKANWGRLRPDSFHGSTFASLSKLPLPKHQSQRLQRSRQPKL